MKLVSLSTLAILVVNTSISAYAGENHGIIVKHEEWHEVPLPVNLKPGSINTSNANTTATAYPASGFVNQNIQVSGYVSYYILNDSTTNQNYWVDKYMCIDNQHCTHIRDTVQLGSHLTAQGGGTIYTYGTFSQKGTHQDEAIIQVSGISNSYSQGVNNVYIN
jgi:hypothetical protein